VKIGRHPHLKPGVDARYEELNQRWEAEMPPMMVVAPR